MNVMREMNWGLFGRRSFAFLIDFLIFVTVFTVLIRIFNVFVPGSDVREGAMQLFTAREFNVLWVTTASALVLLGIYMLASYKSARGQTVGHRLAKIRLTRLNGQPVGLKGVLRIIFVAWVRVLVIVIPGPIVANYGGEIIFSIFALIWGFLTILPIPISKTTKVTLWEKLGDYKFEKL